MFKRNSQGLLPKHCTPCPCHSFFRSALNGPAVGCLLGLIPASEAETWNRGDWHPMAINHFLFPGYMIVFCRHHHHHNNLLIIFNWSFSVYQQFLSTFNLFQPNKNTLHTWQPRLRHLHLFSFNTFHWWKAQLTDHMSWSHPGCESLRMQECNVANCWFETCFQN